MSASQPTQPMRQPPPPPPSLMEPSVPVLTEIPIVRAFLDDDRIPPDVKEEVKRRLWGLLTIIFSTTYYEKDDIDFLYWTLRSVFEDIKNEIPDFKHSFQLYEWLEYMEMWFYSMLKRSQRGFFLKILRTQISESYQAQQAQPARRGWWIFRR